ncbi:nitrous oxide reductase accessory protein NosL [Natronorubrum sp. DTA7]|uniref:nitrous oxide reductase accessory protein NosL n=1 Tax=Natronorubrum sp. DTA7 TaxID=3447016 RepID=UPI003F860BC8
MTERDGVPLERRRLLGLLGTGAVAGFAGCSGGDDESDDEDENGTDERLIEPNMEHPGDDPIDFTGDQSCPVCGMPPVNYSRWNAQLAHEDGTGAIFDTTGCLFAYVAATASDSPIENAWTMDYETRDLVDATEAHYVLITDEDAVDDPMTINPRAFGDEADALEFVEDWDAEELTEDDVIGLEDVDRDVAMIYRPGRI